MFINKNMMFGFELCIVKPFMFLQQTVVIRMYQCLLSNYKINSEINIEPMMESTVSD